jgi:DNA-binding protein HU-beta
VYKVCPGGQSSSKRLAYIYKISIIKLLVKEVHPMNKEELVKEIAKKAKVSQKQASEVLAITLETIQKTVSKGKRVTLVGFGSFESRKRAARNGRNPQTGKEIKIPAKTVPAFTAGKKFKELLKK